MAGFLLRAGTRDQDFFFNESTGRSGLSGRSAKCLANSSRAFIASDLASATGLECQDLGALPLAFARNSRPDRNSLA